MSTITRSTARAEVVACSLMLALVGCTSDGHHTSDAGTGAGSDAGQDAGQDSGPSPITVQGTVLDERSESAVVGANVFLTGAAGVITDAAGHFSVSGVTPPYDVAVRAGGTNVVRVFHAISRATPTLVVRSGATTRTAALSGQVTVSGTAADDVVACTVSGEHGLSGEAYSYSAGTSPIAWDAAVFPTTWYGPTSADGIVHCLLEQYSGPTLTNAFHGSLALTFANGAAFTGQSVPLTSVSLASVSGTLVDPDATGTVKLTVGPGFTDGGGYYTSASFVMPGAFTASSPLVPGAFVLVGARDTHDGRSTSTAVPASATITQDVILLAHPAVTAPAAGAFGIAPGATATWTGTSTHVFVLALMFSGSEVEVVTSGTSVALPDVAEFGLAYPAGGTGLAAVREFGLVPSVDALTADAAFIDMIHERGTYQVAASTWNEFTFAN